MQTKPLNTIKLFLFILLCLPFAVTAQTPGAGVDPSAVVLDDFESGSFGKWTERPGKRGEKMKLELMDAENGDFVKFGRYAMKVNIDFTNAQAQQTLTAQITPTDAANLQIPGNAGGGKKLGMWVYATPEVQGVWFRVSTRKIGATSGVTNTDLSSSINWTGWKYVECELPAGHEFHPDCIRFLVLKSASNYYVNGYVIIDNIRVTNKSFKEDLSAPAITAFTGNGKALGGTYDTSNISIEASFSDGGDNASGIDYSRVTLNIDGNEFKEGDSGFSIDETANTVSLAGISLSNGQHKAEVAVADKFGNTAVKSATFTIEASDGKTTKVGVEADEAALVGTPYLLHITTNNPKDIRELQLVFAMNNIGSVDAEGGVTFAESAQSGSSYDYNVRNGYLTMTIKNDIASATSETLATVKINISKNSNPTDILRCSPVSAKAVYADNSLSLFSLFDAFSKNVGAAYDFKVQKRVVGVAGEVAVTDLSGNPVAGATVYAMDEALATVLAEATTGADGVAGGMSFTDKAQAVNIYAEKDGKYTYTRLVRTLEPRLTAAPEFIRSGTTADPMTQKTITWMSNPLLSTGDALMKIAKKADGEAAFTTVTGQTKLLEYNAVVSSGVTKGNRVELKDLEPATTYIYQVGDGTNWSATREFTTVHETDRFSFSVFGDLQALSTDVMDFYISAARTMEEMEERPLFGLNVGDVIDSDDRYDFYSYYGHLFNSCPEFANIDVLSGYGNHEYMGNVDADNCKFINGHHKALPSDNYDVSKVGTGSYAVEYGNMIVISLDWEHRGPESATTLLAEEMKWVDDVLSKTDKTWRVISLHYPVYPNASTPGSQAIFDPILSKHNVQLLFCGHGHTYERVQVKDGKYLVEPGDRRTFVPAIGGTMHIQAGEMRNKGRSSRWMHCAVDGKKMTVTLRDGNNNIVENECFTLYASELGEFAVNFSVAGEVGGTVEATVDGTAISSGDKVEEGKDVVLTATPADGYTVKAWNVNGKREESTATTYTLSRLSAETTVEVEFDKESGVGELESLPLSVYPNPCADIVNVAGGKDGRLRVTDVSGATVIDRTIGSDKEAVDMGGLSAGVYFFVVERDGVAEVKKVVKLR